MVVGGEHVGGRGLGRLWRRPPGQRAETGEKNVTKSYNNPTYISTPTSKICRPFSTENVVPCCQRNGKFNYNTIVLRGVDITANVIHDPQ